MAKITVKPKKDTTQDFDKFEVEVKDVTWKQRCELNDSLMKECRGGNVPVFSWWANVALKFTALKQDELNKYTSDEILSIGNAVLDFANKKK